MLAACARRNSPARSGAPRRRLQFRLGKQPTDAGRRHPDAELAQLATDSPMAPARILAREPQHQLPHLSRQLRPTTPSRRLPPLPANERLMPTQQSPRRHQTRAARRARQVPRCRRQQRPIRHPDVRPHDLPAQDLKLVTQHQQLDVLHLQTTATTNKRPEKGPHGEVKKREGHATNPPNPAPTSDDSNIGALHARILALCACQRTTARPSPWRGHAASSLRPRPKLAQTTPSHAEATPQGRQ